MNREWCSAIEIRAGDILKLANGKTAVVSKVYSEALSSPVTVYNFEVEDYHTYYVGEDSVLVHNWCSTKTQKHQMLSNKNKTYTKKFKSITDKYGLKLNSKDNVFEMKDHLGRHTIAYHEFMLQKIKSFDVIANGNRDIFMKYFKKLTDYVQAHPNVMYMK